MDTIRKIEEDRSDEQLKILKKRDCIDCGEQMDEMSNHQLLPKSVKAGDSISRGKKMEETSHLKFLPTSLKTSNCINQNERLEEETQNLLSTSPPIIHYISHDRFPIAAEQVPPKKSRKRNPSFRKEGGTKRLSIGTFNRRESPDQEYDRVPSKHCIQPRRCQINDNRIESGDFTLKEISNEHYTKTSPQNDSGFFNYLETQQQEINKISNRYPSPSFTTIVPNSLTEPSRKFDESICEVPKIQWSWTKIEGSRLHGNSHILKRVENLDHEPEIASSHNRTSSPTTVGRNFMDYLVANYSHGIFDPHRNRLAVRLILDPKEGSDSSFVFNDKLTPASSSSYKQKAPSLITAEWNNILRHSSNQEICSARKFVQEKRRKSDP
ncbi:hypothetical protein MMC31_005224 [Peltigera leucophlebia]|nr:hypothetical protein [Peltigera leucophlebia]